MDTTSVSLIQRLKSQPRDIDWQKFFYLYSPLIYEMGKRVGLTDVDAEDLVQDVFAHVINKIDDFTYDPKGSFRGWLRTISRHKAIDIHRRNLKHPLNGNDDAVNRVFECSELDLFVETEYQKYLVQRICQLVEGEFEPNTWQAFYRVVTEHRTAREVGLELNLTENAVRVAKCRVLRRIRRELAGLLE